MFTTFAAALVLAQAVRGHVAPFHPSMWCFSGVSGSNINAQEAVNPVYQLGYSGYWMHANTGCLSQPPADNTFLELPAGGSFSVEIAANRAFTSYSYGGTEVSDWADGQAHEELYGAHTECVTSPNLHAQNESMAAGTAFAISYTSDISAVNEDNLVVFTVAPKTPWKLVASYDVPAAMPACPDGGCICAWGWVPNSCGIPNMYMHPFRCTVTGATGTTAVGTPKAPEWCEDDQSKCVSGPKKFIIWNQNEADTVSVSGYDLAGEPKSPGYNTKMGFQGGAQNDIFTGASTGGSSSSGSGSSSSTSHSAEYAPTSSAASASPAAPETTSASASSTSVAPATTESSESSTAAAPATTSSESSSSATPVTTPSSSTAASSSSAAAQTTASHTHGSASHTGSAAIPSKTCRERHNHDGKKRAAKRDTSSKRESVPSKNDSVPSIHNSVPLRRSLRSHRRRASSW
ncbi:hypothetical protein ARMGADRAFT_1013399 [Armillaria gallica]|uniref:Uncharacterized protein n=1 Tax=Armillaria gallica TaxID=47427 RepID=A0A2H3DL08_ARMGA|nr:hypothetical protein ARMGADRAFT_1013399 [Armillaria gallica]